MQQARCSYPQPDGYERLGSSGIIGFRLCFSASTGVVYRRTFTAYRWSIGGQKQTKESGPEIVFVGSQWPLTQRLRATIDRSEQPR